MATTTRTRQTNGRTSSSADSDRSRPLHVILRERIATINARPPEPSRLNHKGPIPSNPIFATQTGGR